MYLEAVGALGLLPHDVHDGLYELGALGVVSLGPVVPGPALPEHKVVRPRVGDINQGNQGNTEKTVLEKFFSGLGFGFINQGNAENTVFD